jgi:hypothetical protein
MMNGEETNMKFIKFMEILIKLWRNLENFSDESSISQALVTSILMKTAFPDRQFSPPEAQIT